MPLTRARYARVDRSVSPGAYTVRLATDDPSGDGEHHVGHGPPVDTKSFTVR